MEFDQILYEKQGEVTVITFNRPEVHNCIGPVTHRELITAWNDFRMDDQAKVAVITGAGDKAFCSGGDLKSAQELMPEDYNQRQSSFVMITRCEGPERRLAQGCWFLHTEF